LFGPKSTANYLRTGGTVVENGDRQSWCKLHPETIKKEETGAVKKKTLTTARCGYK
jgi:hypothetical protein